jgi:ATP-dependent helicase/nuclease subunit A
MPFTARCTAKELADAGVTLDSLTYVAAPDGEFIVVQGFVDLAVIAENEILLLDFKTDALAGAELAEKIKQYGPQLRLYALALERIYRLPVRERWLHFLELGRSVLVV